MSTSGYYDEIAKVEALRRQRLWRLKKRPDDSGAGHVTRRAKQMKSETRGAVSASFQKRHPA